MGMQRIQGDLNRIYQTARAEAGGPGDLAAKDRPVVPEPARPPTPATPAAPVSAAPAGDERDELVAVIRELYSTGLITATGGNLSIRIPGTQNLWITPSALFKGDLRPEVMVRIDLQGRTLDEDARSPSSEWRMHCAIYAARSDVEAVIHAHAPYATMLVLSGLPFLPISTEAAFLGDVPRVPFIMPGTQELAEAVAGALGPGPAVLLQNHGILVAASSLRRAADMAEVLERTSQLILGCHSVGQTPPVLPSDILATLREAGKMMA
jgi:autoinducer 2 (AI-2) kinase